MATPLQGIGLQPAGVSTAGLGVPATVDPLGGRIYNEPLAADTGTGRYIDPVTRQYLIDANGRPLGMRTVPQIVQLAVSSVDWSTIRVIGPNHQKQCETLLTDVLADPIERRLVEVLRVDVRKVGAAGTEVTLVWRDLTTNTEERTGT